MRARAAAALVLALPALLPGAAFAQTAPAATPFLRGVAEQGTPPFLRDVNERYGLQPISGAGDMSTGVGTSTLNAYRPFTYTGDGVIQYGTAVGGGGAPEQP